MHSYPLESNLSYIARDDSYRDCQACPISAFTWMLSCITGMYTLLGQTALTRTAPCKAIASTAAQTCPLALLKGTLASRLHGIKDCILDFNLFWRWL